VNRREKLWLDVIGTAVVAAALTAAVALTVLTLT
jgi:hypothetical protein